MVKKRYIELAKREATKSHMGHKHGAVIVDNNTGRVLSKGCNQYVEFCHTSRRLSLHAEINAISNCRKSQLKNSTLYVVRLDKAGNLKYSKPCDKCMRFIINKTDISGVYYSLSEK